MFQTPLPPFPPPSTHFSSHDQATTRTSTPLSRKYRSPMTSHDPEGALCQPCMPAASSPATKRFPDGENTTSRDAFLPSSVMLCSGCWGKPKMAETSQAVPLRSQAQTWPRYEEATKLFPSGEMEAPRTENSLPNAASIGCTQSRLNHSGPLRPRFAADIQERTAFDSITADTRPAELVPGCIAREFMWSGVPNTVTRLMLSANCVAFPFVDSTFLYTRTAESKTHGGAVWSGAALSKEGTLSFI